MSPDRGTARGAAAARDAGLRRVSRLTRWLLAGALALTAAFSAIAAHAFPGHSGGAQASSTTTQNSGTTQSSGTGSDDQSGQSDSGSSGSGLQAPSSSPFASGGSGSVTSGGS